ncbi:hypothetical protein [Pleionea sp. CnH1-48]|uniref:hypothetical protein n=1 Tax=Pleionea sp. CnH1-48 TaxID=2954494 RepID=UPI0020969DCE|nr:hypothetical protein [Pleionea sp. CnH1-48]MCO7225397.1 hypothetical protein [Pleionea sp. CnH1-48]
MNTSSEQMNDKHSDSQPLVGNTFIFNHQGHEVSVCLNDLTGRQMVYVDDAIVSDKYSLLPTAIHHFRLWEKDFRIVIQRRQFFDAGVSCKFYHDLELLDEDERPLIVKGPFGKTYRGLEGILMMTAVGFVAGFITVRLMTVLIG